MGDHVFLKVMPKRGVVRFGKRGETVTDVYWALRDTQDGGSGCVSISTTTKLIRCPRGFPCLHALEVYSRSNSCGGLGIACH